MTLISRIRVQLLMISSTAPEARAVIDACLRHVEFSNKSSEVALNTALVASKALTDTTLVRALNEIAHATLHAATSDREMVLAEKYLGDAIPEIGRLT